jgi:di/tricarboxylate transporter
MDAARRTRVSPSKLLIPVAYGSLLGGTATYFTSANIIVSSLLQSAHPAQQPLKFLDFTATGGLIAIAGLIFLGLSAYRLLPDRRPSVEQSLARLTGTELEEAYALSERLWEGRIRHSSSLVGCSLKDSQIGEKLGIVIVAMRQDSRDFAPPPLTQALRANDVLLIVGRQERVSKLGELGIQVKPEEQTLTNLGLTLLELAPAPRSSLIGKTLKEINFHGQYGFLAVALLRGQRSYRTDVANIPIEAGDSLLIVGRRRDIPALHRTADFIIFEEDPSDMPLNKRRTIWALGIMVAAIAASVAGVPVYLAMLTAAVVAFLSGGLTVEEGYQAVEWQAVFLIAGMYVVSTAMVETQLAGVVGDRLLAVVEPLGPLGLAAGAYLLTGILTQFMGGQVTALVTGPITISAAIQMGVNPQAIAVATAIGCSASFLTPLAHPVNILMITPGHYSFGDYFRSGWMLTIISFIMLLVGMVLFWHLWP